MTALRRGKGFTLVELMVTVTIFAFMIGAIYATARAASRSISSGEQATEMYQTARSVLRELSDSLANAYPLGIADTNASLPERAGEAAAANQQRAVLFNGVDGVDEETGQPADSITLTSVASRQSAPAEVGFDLAQVTYALKRDSDTGKLWLTKSVNHLPGLEPEDYKPEEVPLSDTIESLDLIYYDPERAAWVPEWDSADSLPEAVTITVSVTPPALAEFRARLTAHPLRMSVTVETAAKRMPLDQTRMPPIEKGSAPEERGTPLTEGGESGRGPGNVPALPPAATGGGE